MRYSYKNSIVSLIMLRLFLVFLLLLSRAISDQTQSGLRVTVTENTLKEINNAEIKELRNNLDGKRFDDKAGRRGDLDYRLSNIRITYLGSITADVDLRGQSNSVNWNGYLSSISIEADWRVTGEVDGWWSFDVSDSGSVDLDVGRTSVGISVLPSVSNGFLQIGLGSCNANIGNLDIDFDGGLLSWILNILTDVFKDGMKSKLETAICDAVRKSLNKVSEDMRNIDTTFDTDILDLRAAIDNSFTQITVMDNSIASYHKGTLTWNGQTFGSTVNSEPFLTPGSLDLCFDIRTGIVSEFLRATAAAGAMDGSMTYFSADEESRNYFLLSCDRDICIGNIIKEASTLYPNRFIGLYWKVTDASFHSWNDELTIIIVGRLNVNADNATKSDNLFSSQFNVTIPAQVKLTGARVAARANGLKGWLTVDESTIGTILTPETKALIRILQKGMKTTLLNHINALSTSYDVKLPKEVSIHNSQISIYPGFVRVAVDVCYKRSCSFQGPGEWVGNSSLADDITLDLNDIVPTTTTTTTTSTTTTTTSPSTTPTTTRTTQSSNKVGSQTSSAKIMKSSAILTIFLFLVFN